MRVSSGTNARAVRRLGSAQGGEATRAEASRHSAREVVVRHVQRRQLRQRAQERWQRAVQRVGLQRQRAQSSQPRKRGGHRPVDDVAAQHPAAYARQSSAWHGMRRARTATSACSGFRDLEGAFPCTRCPTRHCAAGATSAAARGAAAYAAHAQRRQVLQRRQRVREGADEAVLRQHPAASQPSAHRVADGLAGWRTAA